ncbi:MAG: TetR/AcrR family transcriptional regulator [Lachnospiraceae bacterium]|jgi:AcrR family transcriptional regulator
MAKLTKEEISQTALALFLQQGYRNVTIQDICQACEITKPTFYKYIGSKEELILNLYDVTIKELTTDTYNFLQADTHYEQLLIVFSTLMKDTKKFGSDLFSQMLIANLNENYHSFDMREKLTKLCVMIIKKAQEKGEIKNMNSPSVLYRTLAYAFTGYETMWCIQNSQFNWEEELYESIEAVLDVSDELREVYKKYLTE